MGNLDRRDFVRAAAAMGLAAALHEFGWNLAQAAEEAGPMPIRTLGRTGLQVGILGLGGYHATLHEKEADSIALMHRALDLGINFFETRTVTPWAWPRNAWARRSWGGGTKSC